MYITKCVAAFLSKSATSINFRKDRTALFIVGGFDTERDGAGEVRDEAGLDI